MIAQREADGIGCRGGVRPYGKLIGEKTRPRLAAFMAGFAEFISERRSRIARFLSGGDGDGSPARGCDDAS